ncbi:DUF6191 domain-containing protein [Actinocrispum wychmicini]|uniref:DUF6191 domain-containing protein n=1 Tax=Actinocrispum wychmicini TaxID=1213861 RepID=UPI001FB67476|nr:DUF6191 domain-containing protein [Actinocrispum wychmicini]
MSLPALVFLLLALGVLERVWRRMRKTRKTGGLPVSGASFDEFTAFLYGTKRYELDQRATQSLMREEENDGAPPNQVDLDSGVVVLRQRDTRD